MSRYWNTDDNYSQISVAELRRKASETTKKAAAKGQSMTPVIVSGRQITKSWWGTAWCKNLEQYADYSSRLQRGKRYIRSDALVDLKIQGGKILARVQGTRKVPYKVEIHISPLSEERCQDIIQRCGRKIENLEALVSGDFPDDLKELFLSEGGLFPSPREISFQCSCPDWALLCKHVAVALYGVGVRVDENPFLFFALRGINIDRFIDVTLSSKTEQMLENAKQPSNRIIENADVADLFGIF